MNRVITLLALIVLSVSSIWAQSVTQTGKFSVNPATPGYTLDKNTGERTVSLEVSFKKPFDVKPTIVLSVTSLDAEKDTNCRYNIEAISVSRDGFTVKVTTWGDSKIYGVGGTWIALNE